MTSASDVSVIVPVRDGGPAFDACVSRLVGLVPAPLEIIVVDDGSADGSGERAAAAGLRVIRLAPPHGPAAARNRGAQAAGGEILWFLDADVLPPSSGVAQVGAALSDGAIDAVIGSYDRHPTAPNFLSQFKNLAHRHAHQTGRDDAFTFWGACGAIRRRVFLAAGGFDERYRTASIEDIELGYRLRHAGHQIRLVKSLEVTHMKRWTAGRLLHSDVVQRALPWSELVLREGRLQDDLNLSRRARVGVLAAGGLGLTVALAPWVPEARPLAAVPAAAMLVSDLPLLRYLAAERGVSFAARAAFWRVLYHFYSGAAFLAAWLRWQLRGARFRKVQA